MKKPPVTEGQWGFAQELSDGAPVTRARIAGVLGVDVSSVYARSVQDRWRTMNFRRVEVREAYQNAVDLAAGFGAKDGAGEDGWLSVWPGGAGLDSGAGVAGGEAVEAPGSDWDDIGPVEMLARGSRFAARQVGRLIERADRLGGRIDKKDIDALFAMQRMLEGWEAMARERELINQKKSDDELAQLLDQINRKILALADEEAARLVAAGHPA